MKDKLEKLMDKFCDRFGLQNLTEYSSSLSNEDIFFLNSFFSGLIIDIINKHGADFELSAKKITRELKSRSKKDWLIIGMLDRNKLEKIHLFFKCVRKGDFVKEDLSELLDIEYGKVVLYCKIEPFYLLELERIYRFVIENNLMNTYPLITPKGSIFGINHDSNAMQTLIHESIHHLLVQNKISFGDEGRSPLDEGLCVFLHLRFDKYVWKFKHGKGKKTKQFRQWAEYFDFLCRDTDDKDILPFVVTYSQSHNMIKEMKVLLKEGFDKYENLSHIDIENHVKLNNQDVLGNGILYEYQDSMAARLSETSEGKKLERHLGEAGADFVEVLGVNEFRSYLWERSPQLFSIIINCARNPNNSDMIKIIDFMINDAWIQQHYPKLASHAKHFLWKGAGKKFVKKAEKML